MIRRILVVVACAAIGVGLAAAPAGAHAALETSEPAPGAELADAPTQVVLTFNESVETQLGGVQVFASNGDPVDVGAIGRLDGDLATVTAALPELEPGAYVVSWRVVSSDSHPISGAFTFSTGEAGDVAGAESLADSIDGSAPSSTSVAFGVARGLGFVGIALLIGALSFVVLIDPGAARRRSTLVVGAIGWALTLGATAASIVLQGAYATARPLADAFSSTLVRSVLDTRYGQVSAGRLVLAALGFGALLLTLRFASNVVWRVAAVIAVVALAATPGLAGHAATGDWVPFAVVFDTIHVAAMGTWLGGLVLVLFAVRAASRTDGALVSTKYGSHKRPIGGGGDAAALQVVSRFSAVAFWSVVAIVVSGVFATWRQVGTLDALTSTDYGRLLMLKVGVVVALVGVAWLSRRVLDQWRRDVPNDEPVGDTDVESAAAVTPEWNARTRIRVSLTIEIVLAILVLAITAALVETPPARDAVSAPVSRTVVAEPLTFDLTVEPARTGDNIVHVYVFDEDGVIFDPEAVSLEIRLADPEIGPLEVPLVRIATGHWQADSADLPLPGDWVFTIAGDIDQFTRASGSTQIPVK